MDRLQQTASFIRGTRWDALPGSVQRKAKLCFLDSLGAALSGTLTRISAIGTEFAANSWKGDEASILLRGKRASAAGAAFANGCAANGFDSDDGAIYTKGHPGAQLLPTVLAVGEKLGSSGKQVLSAMVVGYEVAIRTARCWHDDHATYQACGSWGSVANAAAAAHLMGLNKNEIIQALGIAEYYAPNVPMMRDVESPAMVKHGIGWGAMTGIIAGELASCGFSGIPSLLGFEKYASWVGDIGENYLVVDGVAFKEFACCSWSHPPLLAARALMEEHSFSADAIVRIRIEGFAETCKLGTAIPKTTEEAQFNAAWPLACYLLYGEVGPLQINDDCLRDERVIRMVRCIQLQGSEELTRLAHLKWAGDPRGQYACRMHIELDDGRILDSGVVGMPMGYATNWDENRTAEKFTRLVRLVLPNKKTQDLVNLVWSLDSLDDLRGLIALVR